MRHTAATLLVLSLGGHALHAQDVHPGTQVRITSQHYSLSDRVGVLLSETGDSMVVRFTGIKTVQYRQVWADDTITIARNAVDRFEVSGRGGSQTKRGAIVGGAIGVGVGLFIGLASYKECQPANSLQCIFDPGPSGSGFVGAVAGGAIGAVTGAVIGSTIQANKWVTVTPHGVGLSIAF